METRMDTKAPVWLPTSPIIGGSFLMNRPRTQSFYTPLSTRHRSDFGWLPMSPPNCKGCNSRRFRPKAFGLCTDCFADRIAVIQHEERLAA